MPVTALLCVEHSQRAAPAVGVSLRTQEGQAGRLVAGEQHGAVSRGKRPVLEVCSQDGQWVRAEWAGRGWMPCVCW